MEPCDRYQELICTRADRPLTPEEEAALQAHLAVCPACQHFAREMEALCQDMDRQAVPDRADPAPDQGETKAHRKGFLALLVGGSVTAAVLLAVLAVLVLSGTTGPLPQAVMDVFSFNQQNTASVDQSTLEGAGDLIPLTPRDPNALPIPLEPTQPEEDPDQGQDTGPTQPVDSGSTNNDAGSSSNNNNNNNNNNNSSSGGSGGSQEDPGQEAPLTQAQAQAKLEAALTALAREGTLTGLGLVENDWTFALRDPSGQTLATFLVDQTTGQLREQTPSGPVDLTLPGGEEGGGTGAE